MDRVMSMFVNLYVGRWVGVRCATGKRAANQSVMGCPGESGVVTDADQHPSGRLNQQPRKSKMSCTLRPPPLKSACGLPANQRLRKSKMSWTSSAPLALVSQRQAIRVPLAARLAVLELVTEEEVIVSVRMRLTLGQSVEVGGW